MTLTEKKFDLTLLAIRLVVALVILAHGVQKLFGWFGGFGFDATMGFFTQSMGLPYLLALFVILAETIGMLFLITGLFSRYISLIVIAIMAGAIFTVHASQGFFMNWFGTLKGEGYEYHILIIALALVTVVHGAGAYSLDQLLLSKKKQTIIDQKATLV